MTPFSFVNNLACFVWTCALTDTNYVYYIVWHGNWHCRFLSRVNDPCPQCGRSECAFRNHVFHSRIFQPGVYYFTVFNFVLLDQNIQSIKAARESSTAYNRSPGGSSVLLSQLFLPNFKARSGQTSQVSRI